MGIMDIQVLIATMHQTDHSLLDKMNIQTEAIVGNQCEVNEVEEFELKNHRVKWLSFSERGVGLNRNNTLMRASGDVVIFADDDMVYVEHYADLVAGAYQRHPDADVIIFNLKRSDLKGSAYVHSDVRVSWRNYMRYGAARITARLRPLRLHGITFNQCFGGGTEHSCGEDTLFLTSCLKAKLKIYAVPEVIAELQCERESTWFQGYTEKYFQDKGVLYKVLSRKWWRLLCMQDAFRHRSLYKKGWLETYRLMVNAPME